jgi:hypothetical protein
MEMPAGEENVLQLRGGARLRTLSALKRLNTDKRWCGAASAAGEFAVRTTSKSNSCARRRGA